jgi:hypothetical protein
MLILERVKIKTITTQQLGFQLENFTLKWVWRHGLDYAFLTLTQINELDFEIGYGKTNYQRSIKC